VNELKAKAAIEVIRPINCLMGSLTVIIGVLNTRTGVPLLDLILNLIIGVITYILIAGSGMVINDIYDIEIDRINRPERPIPRGDLTLKEAKYLYLGIMLIGILLSVFHSWLMNLGFINIVVAAFFAFIGWLYAAWGKKSGFIGNIIVSVSFSIGLLYGAILNGYNLPLYIYFFFLTSFFLLLAREIVKGCEDIEGDKREGVKTLAITIGIQNALYVSIVCDAFAIIFFVLPVFTNIINLWAFIISMLFGLGIVFLALVLSLISDLEKKSFSKISLLLKIGAFLGLLAFVFASI
jgi:geranylgeranylglycerol-phosphate geranylgeranyltransferase